MIKEVGGLLIAQDPTTAKFSGMPRSAINTGLVDQVLGPENIPVMLSNYTSFPRSQAEIEVGDKEVFSILLNKLLEPQFRDGAVLDGFPRTQVQVQCLQALVDKITQLHGEFADTPLATQFRRPTVHAMVIC